MRRLFLLLSLLLVATQSHAKEEQVRSTIRVNQYNSAAEQYLERPTQVTVRGKPGKQELTIYFAPYGGSISKFPRENYANFTTENVVEYLRHVSKFMEWAELATAAGDEFAKEIGTVQSTPGFKLKFEFHSGNAKSHFLGIILCVLGTCGVSQPLYFDVGGAKELVSLLTKLKNGELPGEDVGDKYK